MVPYTVYRGPVYIYHGPDIHGPGIHGPGIQRDQVQGIARLSHARYPGLKTQGGRIKA